MSTPAESTNHAALEPVVTLDVAPVVEELGAPAQGNRLTRFLDAAKSLGQWAAIAAEVGPGNEIARLALYATATAVSPTPVVGALAAGLSTFLIEGGSGLAAAGLLNSDGSDRLIRTVNEKGAKLGLPMHRRLSPASKVFWTFMGGAPLGMWLEQREDPSRTVEQNRKYALLTAAWQGGVLAVAGAGGSEVVHSVIEQPLIGTAIALGVAAVTATGVWVKRKGFALIERMRQRAIEARAHNADQYYEVYSQIVRKYGRDSPQHQGLTAADFESVLQDDRVVTTDLKVEGGRVEFPQLSPVEHYEWLNTEFYARKFPDEYASGRLLHYTDMPTITPGKRVRERIRELADDNGVLVFDYPSSDPEYPKRVQRLLETLGIDGSEIEVVGTQTYFAGRLRLRREHDADEPVLSLGESFSAMRADDEYDDSGFVDGASYRSIIDPDQAEVMRQFYDKAYVVLNDHPCNQGLDPAQFYEMMSADENIAKIVNSRDGRITSLMLLDNDLDHLSWVNAEYYRRHFPDKAESGQIYWFPGLAADPESPQRHNLQAMVGLTVTMLERGNNEILVVFDCCDYNSGTLDRMLNILINRTPEATIDIKPIANQTYCAIRLSRKQ